jgi:diguanylate cyclase (GGDEF)-like protein
LILPQTGCNIALGVAERLNEAVKNLSHTTGSMPLTLSIGLTEAVLADDAASLLARADKALYQAKSDGRNCRRVITADSGAAHGSPSAATLGPIMIHPAKTTLLQ